MRTTNYSPTAQYNASSSPQITGSTGNDGGFSLNNVTEWTSKHKNRVNSTGPALGTTLESNIIHKTIPKINNGDSLSVPGFYSTPQNQRQSSLCHHPTVIRTQGRTLHGSASSSYPLAYSNGNVQRQNRPAGYLYDHTAYHNRGTLYRFYNPFAQWTFAPSLPQGPILIPIMAHNRDTFGRITVHHLRPVVISQELFKRQFSLPEPAGRWIVPTWPSSRLGYHSKCNRRVIN